MKIHGLFLDSRLTSQEKENLYNECIGCLNRICVTDNKTEVLTMLASLQVKAMLLGKNTFYRIDETSENNSINEISFERIKQAIDRRFSLNIKYYDIKDYCLEMYDNDFISTQVFTQCLEYIEKRRYE